MTTRRSVRRYATHLAGTVLLGPLLALAVLAATDPRMRASALVLVYYYLAACAAVFLIVRLVCRPTLNRARPVLALAIAMLAAEATPAAMSATAQHVSPWPATGFEGRLAHRDDRERAADDGCLDSAALEAYRRLPTIERWLVLRVMDAEGGCKQPVTVRMRTLFGIPFRTVRLGQTAGSAYSRASTICVTLWRTNARYVSAGPPGSDSDPV